LDQKAARQWPETLSIGSVRLGAVVFGQPVSVRLGFRHRADEGDLHAGQGVIHARDFLQPVRLPARTKTAGSNFFLGESGPLTRGEFSSLLGEIGRHADLPFKVHPRMMRHTHAASHW
jgi:hypothetical protein